MILKELITLNESAVPTSIKGWLAMTDTEGETNNIEGVFVFKSSSDAQKFRKGLDKDLDGSDEYATEAQVDEYYIVFHCDHRVDEEMLFPVMFDVSKTKLIKRLKADVAAGAIYGVSSFEQIESDVVYLKTN